MAESAIESPRRILLIKPSSLGDIIHALPVLDALHTSFPQAKIDWLVASSLAGILQGHPLLNRLVLFERSRIRSIGRMVAAAGDFLDLTMTLRRAAYDCVVDLQGLLRSGVFAWLTRSPRRIGFRAAREGAWVFYTESLDSPAVSAHAVDRNLSLLSALKIPQPATPRFPIAVSKASRAKTRSALASVGIPEGAQWLAIVPSARWETKVWPVERFGRLIDEIWDAAGIPSVLLGGAEDAATCLQLEQTCRSRPKNLAGRTGLADFASMIESASVVLCHDSAAAHIAAALERPLVCLMGPTNPERTGPYRRLHDVIREPVPCSPCYLRRLSQCPHQHCCMKDLAVARVRDAILQRFPK